ncbi:IS4 family transposase [Candidatus Competibacter phosphatis]|uniref:IS4 family transposase n=1 Tax=Candidatus Competibacter phosphatis TaxID=221280 RepID=A0ABX1TSP9_9GAMM|nr:IS4 family transposase [Candidatus Competibacter phosphatis]
MQVVMCYCGIDAALRETAGNFTLLEERISDTAIYKRLKACVPWVKALLGRMMGEAFQPVTEGRLRFLIVDGSTVQAPGAKGTDYRLHIAIDLVRLHLIHVKVTDAHEGERLDHYPLQDGDVVVLDRGYNQAQMWIDHVDRGISLIVRYNPHSLNLHDAEGQQIEVDAVLRKATTAEVRLPVQVHGKKKEFMKGYLHARRLPAAPAAQARRRARAEARKKGRAVQQRTLALAEWVLLFTTLAPEVLPTETVMALYRVRWQVELAIKQLKSILNMDHLRAKKDSVLADLYLHGKLLYAWVIEKRLGRRSGLDWNRLDQPRRATPWRVVKLLRQEFMSAISGVHLWDFRRWVEALQVMRERPRRRALQTVPERIRQLIADCQARGVSNI